MKFGIDLTIKLSDIISAVSLCFVIWGAVRAYREWCNKKQFQRASYLNEFQEKARTDEEIRDTLYMFEYDQHWYNKDFHSNKKLEPKVDKTLDFYSYICYLKAQRLIDQAEFRIFEYRIKHLLMNRGVQDYLYNLYHYANRLKRQLSFVDLYKYGKKNHLFAHGFKNKNAWKKNDSFHHSLHGLTAFDVHFL